MPRGITEDDVLKAADELLAKGARPTIERVRHHLGRGSPNTVNRHLETWWSGLAERLQGGAAVPELPAELTQSLVAAWQVAQQEAREAATAAFTTQNEYLAEREQALEDAQVRLSQHSERIESECALLRQQVEIHAQDAERARAQVNSLKRQLADTQFELKESRDATKTAEREATRQLDAANQRFEKALGQAESNERRWLSEIDSVRTTLRERDKKFDDAKQGIQQLRVRADAVGNDLSRAEAQCTQWKARYEDEVTARRQDAELAAERINEVVNRAERAESQLARENAESERLRCLLEKAMNGSDLKYKRKRWKRRPAAVSL